MEKRVSSAYGMTPSIFASSPSIVYVFPDPVGLDLIDIVVVNRININNKISLNGDEKRRKETKLSLHLSLVPVGKDDGVVAALAHCLHEGLDRLMAELFLRHLRAQHLVKEEEVVLTSERRRIRRMLVGRRRLGTIPLMKWR